jgi:hypothetical protein
MNNVMVTNEVDAAIRKKFFMVGYYGLRIGFQLPFHGRAIQYSMIERKKKGESM